MTAVTSIPRTNAIPNCERIIACKRVHGTLTSDGLCVGLGDCETLPDGEPVWLPVLVDVNVALAETVTDAETLTDVLGVPVCRRWHGGSGASSSTHRRMSSSLDRARSIKELGQERTHASCGCCVDFRTRPRQSWQAQAPQLAGASSRSRHAPVRASQPQ